MPHELDTKRLLRALAVLGACGVHTVTLAHCCAQREGRVSWGQEPWPPAVHTQLKESSR